jgi:hypothetical protein
MHYKEETQLKEKRAQAQSVGKLLAVQVAHGLAAFWNGMLDGQQQNQHRCGLTKLLAAYGLQPHTTKEGIFAWWILNVIWSLHVCGILHVWECTGGNLLMLLCCTC